MALLGGRKIKKESNDHLVVALSQKDTLLICNQTKAASSVLAKLLQLRRGAKSKSCRGGKESRQEAWGVLRYEETVTGLRDPLRL